MTGAELKFAAANGIPVFYEETYHNPKDEHMNFQAECVMEEAESGYYIGNSDINPDDFADDALCDGEFGEGTFRVSSIPGQRYSA